MNIDQVHRMVLDGLLEERRITSLNEEEKRSLTFAWHRIRAWPDARSGLSQLRSRFTVSGLSVLSLSLLVSTSKAADLHWDALVSCEFLGHYKPDPLAYQKGVELLGFRLDEAMMVAAHPSDLRGARDAGLRTAYVPRPGEWGDDDDRELESGEEFDVVATDFEDLALKLGAV
ncbi:MAG: HAD-IA family hydrolase [Bryobacterales bacterium]